ncbi:hypothetical protein BOTBODRAFT_175647 [Botryobasidium botryosum FD-172 SS1]|uniref:FAD-binding FR-type domain-containing protein n=1 Tax=Botryobasidium botryosum (strain FD-172 SS1) TaxID=930990 RepID=A0A067MCT4_BOTB1|nr:hypothetical protein BOTBODRAFT_175647 [Botryobasidium botryosum FD-172 SS1]
MGLPWLIYPVEWQSSRVPDGYDYSLMTPEEIKLLFTPFHDWWTADLDYAQTTVEFLCAGIAILFLFNAVFLLRARKNTPGGSRAGLIDRLTAALRFTTARQFYVRAFDWYSPPLAALVGVCGIFMFVMALLLAARPYYWPNMAMGMSPPIATRAGPQYNVLFRAFATKVNFVGLLAGTSHEKLQVFHRWSAMFMYITSLVHTFPFIVNNIKMGQMVAQYEASGFYWTGIAALVPQTWLVAMSWGFFRNRYYETFKKLHFIAAGIFMAALFVHCTWTLTSWHYFWATLAIYGSVYLFRVCRTFYNSAAGLNATIQELPDRMVKVSVAIPGRLKWAPGQHVFVRFLDAGIHSLSTHPFTVSNLSTSVRSQSKDEENVQGGARTLNLVLRIRGGISAALARKAAEQPKDALVLIDGPYGGVPLSLRTFDRVYLLAGGSGATFTLPLLMDLVQGFSDHMTCKHVEFILAVRENDSPAWMEEDLSTALAAVDNEGLTVRIHVTRTESDPTLLDHVSSSSVDAKNAPEPHIRSGRPNLPEIIRSAARSDRGRVAIAACGPDPFLYDVRNAVAECQLAIAAGRGKCKELFLHTENYRFVQVFGNSLTPGLN